ncbi:MAG TPA: bifunctional 5,10-methylenetetrahydrofolate dehydrogenase/5,10-methenyltetrahydrofolate cyclohydrolase [Patescibacteria group bacterium]|nr:bifunctional 5,10-methylenetetrahydrofolate dehydrogenase/5,10-methenyltetrahydrofolate cyclohydrolase [Patescibacteria group bacterium]
MTLLDGKALNEKIAEKLKAEISRLETLRARGPLGRRPKLVIIQVGDLAESNAYIGRKIKFGEKIGAVVDHQKFPNTITQEKLITQISSLNTDSSVTGIIVQMPLPKHIDRDEVIDSIDPAKDVDGLTSRNLKLLWEAKGEGFVPATTKGIISLLDEYKIPIVGKHVVVVGRSFLVGKPTFLAFLNHDATVTVCHRHTKNLAKHSRSADILVVAAGKPNLIGKEHVHKNQVVIDVGINAVQNEVSPRGHNEERPRSTLVGDVNFAEVSKIVKAISPVPGGAGPMTVASLFENLLEAYNRQIS